MTNRYWDKLAATWAADVFNTYKEDRTGVVESSLKQVSSLINARSAADYGCGTGSYLPLLSRLFDTVVAFDRSALCVSKAAGVAHKLGNVGVFNTQKRGMFAGKMDLVLCVNVVIHPDRHVRERAVSGALDLIRPGGALMLVVPSIESASLIYEVSMGAYFQHKGHPPGSKRRYPGEIGVVPFGGVPTKHFGKEELLVLASDLGLENVSVTQVQYSWASHGLCPRTRPPSTPWDWLLIGFSRS